MRRSVLFAGLFFFFCSSFASLSSVTHAYTLGSSLNSFEIEFVPFNDAGYLTQSQFNSAVIDYSLLITKYEVPGAMLFLVQVLITVIMTSFLWRFLMKRVMLALIFSLFVGDANSSEAAIIYSQTTPSEPTAAFGSTDSAISQKSADNFSISGSESITIRSLRFIGGSGPESAPPDVFRVVFLEDVNGVPGNPIVGGDFSIGEANFRQPTGGPLLNGVTIPLEYTINLPSEVTLSSGSAYWLSITNNLLPLSGWAWARAAGMLDQTTAATTGSIESGPWITFETGGMWFELNSQIIPEPSSILILLIWMLAMSFSRELECKKCTSINLYRHSRFF